VKDVTTFLLSFLNQRNEIPPVRIVIGNQNSQVQMNIILWIIFGAIAGWIGSIMGRNAQTGALANIVVGIVGALIRLYYECLGAQGVTGFNLTSLIVAILGAVVLLFLVGWFAAPNKVPDQRPVSVHISIRPFVFQTSGALVIIETLCQNS
jgi:uncharacterized membrane protein YeaQ/YmgE (transglycosylase-associated protein family)